MNPCAPIDFDLFAQFLFDNNYATDPVSLAGIIAAVARLHWQSSLEYIEGDLLERAPSCDVSALIDKFLAMGPRDAHPERSAHSSGVVALFQQQQQQQRVVAQRVVA